MTKTNKSMLALGVIVLLAAIGFYFFFRTADPVPLNPGAFVDALQKKGWTYVDLPRELLGPGSVVSISEAKGISYRGRIDACITNPDVLKVQEGNAGLSGQINSSYDLSIDALAKYHAVEAGPAYNKLASFTLTLGETKEYALDTVAISEWIKNNSQSLSDNCRRLLNVGGGEPNSPAQNQIFVLTDVLGVTGYKYTFKGADGAKIKLSQDSAENFFKLGGTADAKVTGDGDVQVAGRVYIAFMGEASPFDFGSGAVPAESAQDTQRKRNRDLFASAAATPGSK